MSGLRQTAAPEGLARRSEPMVLRTLGTLGLFRTESDQPILGPGKPIAFLVYLNAMPDGRASREYLASLLWSDLEPKAARHAVRQAIWQLRQILGEDALATSDDHVTLTCALQSDRERFTTAVEAGRFRDAVEVYRGDFLPGFAVSGGVGFEHWADGERQHVRHLFAHAAENLAREELRQGHFARARDLARRVRDADPLEERGWRLLLETYLAQGDSVSALAEVERLERLLDDEHRPPEPTTRALINRVRVGDEDLESDWPTNSLVAELVGREREFAVLIAAFDGAAKGGAQVFWVVAPPGLGKTRLLQDLGRRLAATGNTAAYVRAHPGDREVAWAYAAEVARALADKPGAPGISPASAAALVALDPALSGRFPATPDSSGGDEARRRRSAALAELVQAVSEERPLALLLDDLHWADPESRGAVLRCFTRLRGHRVLGVLASRPGGATPTAEDQTMLLAPLDRDQITSFVASLGSLPQAPWRERFIAGLESATLGSPLLVLETLHHALERGVLLRSEGIWGCADEQSLTALLETGSALGRRIAQLERPQGWLLLLLALAGIPQSLEVLARASGAGEERTASDLRELERRGLIRRTDTGWLVGHDEIGERATADADPRQLAAAHGAIGQALLRSPGDQMALRAAARHLADAGLKGELRQAGAAWVREARARGDARSARILVHELLGDGSHDWNVRSVMESLPWRLRVTTRTLWTATGTAIAALMFGLTVVLPRITREAPGVMIGYWAPEGDGRWRMMAHELTAADLASGVVDSLAFQPTDVVSANRPEGMVRPGSRDVLATTVAYADTGGLDLAFISARGRRLTRLTHAPGDDIAGAWSPDGRYLSFSTDRWVKESRSDLALLHPDHPDSAPLRLTRGLDDRDGSPLWSPDGTRIAFSRAPAGDPSGQVCLVTMSGLDEKCLDVPGYVGTGAVGWVSPIEIAAFFSDSTGINRLLIVNTESGAHHAVAEGSNTANSHAVGWFGCLCRRSEAEPYQLLVFAATQLDKPIRLDLAEPPPGLALLPSRPSRTHLDRLEIVGADRVVPVDGSYRLQLNGWDAGGHPRTPFAVRWTSSDTTVLTVSAEGWLHPRREGSAQVTASAGGWRQTSRQLRVGPAEATTVVTEDWRTGIRRIWVPFGTPAPYVVASEGRPALAPNGDSTFLSGLYLRSYLPTREGVGLEFEVSVPVTKVIWQRVTLMLSSGDAPAPTEDDIRIGVLPGAEQTWHLCQAAFPAGENVPAQRQILFVAGIDRKPPAPPGMAAGRWTRLRLQFFPDGRCGLAVDGKAEVLIERPLALGDSALVAFHSYSHGTRILVGPGAVWTGVRRDVDWEAVAR